MLKTVALALMLFSAHGVLAAETALPEYRDDCGGLGFLDVNVAKPISGQPQARLEVRCDASQVTVSSNGIPHFEYIQVTPNPLREQRYQWLLPRHPQPAAQSEAISRVGPVAILVNGLPVFGPNEAPHTGYRDPYLDELLDYCGGHTAQRGDYHFHVRAECLLPGRNGQADVVIGYAFDGYPILLPWVCEDGACRTVRKLKSSYRYVGKSSNAWEANRYQAGYGDLDECNGRLREDGSYAYYATDEFPYFLACYHGKAESRNIMREGKQPPMPGAGRERRGEGPRRRPPPAIGW